MAVKLDREKSGENHHKKVQLLYAIEAKLLLRMFVRILLSCKKCINDGKAIDRQYPAELQDNGLYKMICNDGHETVTCLQEQKFEVLFDLALYAILDGYYREAVTSFASALERFYEFYVNVICIKHNINEDVYGEILKKVIKQSERQFGAYLFVYLLENGASPKLLSENQVSFRNDVVHKGKIPSKQEAIKYGQAVLDIIAPVLSRLNECEKDHVQTAVGRYVNKTMEQIKGKPDLCFMSISTTIRINRINSKAFLSVEDALSRILEKRRLNDLQRL